MDYPVYGGELLKLKKKLEHHTTEAEKLKREIRYLQELLGLSMVADGIGSMSLTDGDGIRHTMFTVKPLIPMVHDSFAFIRWAKIKFTTVGDKRIHMARLLLNTTINRGSLTNLMKLAVVRDETETIPHVSYKIDILARTRRASGQ